MNLRSLAAGVAAAVVLSVCVTAAQAVSLPQGIYVLSGTVQSSTPSSHATCPVEGAALAGEALYVVGDGLLHGFNLVIKHSGSIPAVVYLLGEKFGPAMNKKLSYALPPQPKGFVGRFSITPQTDYTFTLETQTASFGKGKGRCDTFYAITLTPGIPAPLDQLF